MVTSPRRTVLCIGDEPVGLNHRCQLLKEHGWTVISSGNSYLGLRSLDHSLLDAAVLDLNADPVEAALIAGELKRQCPSLPVILVVADTADSSVLAAPADVVVWKLRESISLLSALDRVLTA